MYLGGVMMKLNMRKKLILGLISLAVIPVIVTMSIALQNQVETAEEQIIATNLSRVQWAAQYLEETIVQLDKLFYSLQINTKLIDNLAELNEGGSFERMNKHQEISDVLTYSYYANSEKIDALILLDLSSLTTFLVDHNSIGSVGHVKELSDYWSRLESSKTNIYFEEADGLYAVHSFNYFETKDSYGGVAVKINPRVWDTLFEILEPDLKGDVYVFNDNLQLMQGSSSDGIHKDIIEMIGKRKGDYKDGELIQSEGYYHFIHEVDESKLIIVKSVSVNEVLRNSLETLWIGIFVIIVAIFLSVLTALFLSHILSQPIVALAETMKQANESGLNIRHDDINDEIVMLEQVYQDMLGRIKRLIKEEYQHEIDLKNAQLLALQTQINPHFLNNSLNLIGGMALENGSKEIYKLTTSIGKQLRYSLKTSDVLVPLIDEVENIKNYLGIQEARFCDRCDINLEISEILMNLSLPKMILQPIVENAFEHGLQSKLGRWRLDIKARVVRNRLLIAVIDNGDGIESELLQEIRNNIKDEAKLGEKGIGLRNVHSRLRLRFGQPSGLKIFSEKGKGTMMVLTMNIREQIDV